MNTFAPYEPPGVKVPMSAVLCIAFGSTARTFGADPVVVRRALRDIGAAVTPHGPNMAAAIRECRDHVRRAIPSIVALDPPPEAAEHDIADYTYMTRVVHRYGTSIRIPPIPKEATS